MLTDTSISMIQPVLDVMSDELAILDTGGRVTFVNQAWSRSAASGLLTRFRVGDDFPASCESLSANGIRNVLSGQSPEYAFDYPCMANDALSWHAVAFTPFNGDGLRGVLVRHQDITPRMEAELARRDSDLALDALLDASPVAIIVLDMDYQVTRWSKAAEQMFGWTEAEALGRFNPIIQADVEDEFLANIDAMCKAESGVVNLQARLQRKDGALLDVQVSYTAMRGVNGVMRGVMGIVVDVSQSKRQSEQQAFLSQAAEILAASLDYKKALTEVTEIAVPRMADICTVNLIGDDGSIRRLAATHYDPAKQHLVQQVVRSSTVPPEVAWGTARVVETRKPEIKQWPEEPSPDESEQLRRLREIGLRSTLTVPLLARDAVIGTIAFVYSDSGRTYSEADLGVAQSLASRAAAAIDNARLYQDAREAEALYRAIVEHVPAITYSARVDDVNSLIHISSQSNLPTNMFMSSTLAGDYSNNALADGSAWNSLVHPDDAERVRATMDACSASREPLEIEYRIVDEAGEATWRLDRAQLIYDAAGVPLHWQGLVVDITERKRSEETLRIRARQQAAVASLGQRAVGDADLEQMVDDAVSVVFETLDTEFVRLALHEPGSDELVIRARAGQPTGTDVGSVTKLDTSSLLTYTFDAGAPVIIDDLATETRFTPWPGMVEHHVQSGLSVVIPGPGRPHGVIFAATTRKQTFTEDDIHFLQSIANMVSATIERARDEEELRFQAHLLEVISQAVIATDTEGRITYWNHHAEELYGWPSDEVLGKLVADVVVPEQLAEKAGDLLTSLQEGNDWSGEFLMRRKDASTFPSWTMLSPNTDSSGCVRGIVSVTTDISERVQASAERDQLLQNLGERIKELTVLHRAAALFENDEHDLDHILRELAIALPAGMQVPDMATAQLQVGEQRAASGGYCETPWSIRSEFITPDGGPGQIIVCYADPDPHGGDVLFLPEEVSLLDSLADMFRVYLERVHSQQQVWKSEARFRAAIEGTLDAFGILEPLRDRNGAIDDYTFVEVNERAEGLLRRSRKQLIGQTMRQQFLSAQADMFVAAFNRVIETGETIEREVEVPCEDESFWMIYQAVPLDHGVAVFASETTERRRLEEQLIHQAFHDSLTGLANRALFLDRVDHSRNRMRRRHEGIAVLFLDLDNFKIINDSLGHTAGDGLLMAVANRLESCIGEADTAARFGGDEFAILLEDLSDWGSVTDTAEKIVEAFKAPFTVMRQEIHVTPSIGVAVATSNASTARDLLRDADAAMYRAKRNGKARVELFDPSLTVDVAGRFEMENDLRRAIERSEFRVYYQPIVGMQSGQVVCMEALVRWEHPVYGLLAPSQFIPIAEETGLIVQIGRQVLRAACDEAAAWNRDRQPEQTVRLSVNISPRQFRDPRLVDNVVEVLRVSGLDPGLLYLELTESLMVEDESRVRETLQALRAHGVHLAVDDFGTGYSSLGSLRRFPVDVVKIDRVFVSGIEHNPRDALMLSGIIDLAHSMQLQVVAEGVETPGERDRLREMGCDLAQGYLFARPLPAREAVELI